MQVFRVSWSIGHVRIREKDSRYRLYDDRQLHRLRIVALLRQANYDFDAIHTTLRELDAGQPQRALAAVEERRNELARTSWRCLRAMAVFYDYVNEFGGGEPFTLPPMINPAPDR